MLAWCWAKLGRHLVQYSHYIAPRIGKVTQDKFSLTSRLLVRSLLAALPLPAMVLMMRGLLDGAWQYPSRWRWHGALARSGSCCWRCWSPAI